MDIYPLRAIPVFALILCLISGSIVIINPNNYKPALAQQQEQEQQENKQSALSIVGSMRENNHNLTATNRPPLTQNRRTIHLPKIEARYQPLKIIVILMSLGKVQE
jgi:hypothetical protein